MRNKLSLSVILIICFSIVCSGCGKQGQFSLFPNNTDAVQTATQYKLNMIKPNAYRSVKGLSLEPGSSISIIGRYDGDSYWKEVERGATQAVEELNEALGYKGKDKITISYRAPKVRDNIDEQINLLDEELNRHPDVLAIAPIDAAAYQIQFQFASENQIPILTFDSGSDYQQTASHIATDNVAASEAAATQFANALNKKGSVLIFAPDSSSTTSNIRVESFMNTLKNKFPDISVVDICYMNQISEAEILSVLSKYPNLNGIYTTSMETTQLVAGALEQEDILELTFIGFDGGPKQVNLLENEILDGFIIQNPYGIGYATVVASIRATLGMGNESFVNTGYDWVSKDTLETEEIKNMLY